MLATSVGKCSSQHKRVYETYLAGDPKTEVGSVQDLGFGSGYDFAKDGKEQSSPAVSSAEK